MSHSLTNQSYLTANIDRLVRDILCHPIHSEDIKNQLNELYQPFMESYNNDLVYSKPIEAFVSSTTAIVGDSYPCNVIWNQYKTQRFIDTLLFYQNNIKIEDHAWYYQESQNSTTLNGYTRNLTDHYSRLLFVRVDLKYLQETSHLVTIEDFNDHMNKIRDLIGKTKACFKHLQGNAWALEQGYENGGFHCHLLLMYDGSKREGDWALAKEVGERWESITEGLGTYYNVHNTDNKKKYLQEDHLGNNRLGIGMIHRNKPQQVENAVNVALYLTKTNKQAQHLKVWLPGMRTFGRGLYNTPKRRGIAS